MRVLYIIVSFLDFFLLTVPVAFALMGYPFISLLLLITFLLLTIIYIVWIDFSNFDHGVGIKMKIYRAWSISAIFTITFFVFYKICGHSYLEPLFIMFNNWEQFLLMIVFTIMLFLDINAEKILRIKSINN